MRRKRAKKLPTGSASSKKVRKWHLEDYLEFMNVVECERETVTNTITQDDETKVDGQETENVEMAEESVYSEIRDPEDLNKDLSEEPEQLDGDGESILKVFKRNSEERSKLMSAILDKPKEQHPIDVFFQSMAMTVKKFSPENQIRARTEICQIVSQLELEEVNRAHNVPRFDDKSSTSCSSNLTLQSPSILNDDDEYDFTLLTNTCGMKFK
ncbi:hypothetical protein J6590_005041 [Homalodisca vitripennis]|nr:hypothetical protein J6590_005041 [Homalodisca vitripennis]